jgi:hypothetical protein
VNERARKMYVRADIYVKRKTEETYRKKHLHAGSPARGITLVFGLMYVCQVIDRRVRRESLRLLSIDKLENGK